MARQALGSARSLAQAATAVLVAAALGVATPGSGAAVPPGPVSPTAPGVPAVAAAPAPRAVTDLPPASLPPSPPVATTVDPVAFAPGPRDAGGTREVRAPGPLRLVAVTWTGPAPDAVALRTTDATGAWGTWTPLDAEAGRDDVPGGGTDPVWVGDRRAVEVRATRAGAPVTDEVSVLRIDPGASPNDAAIGGAGRAAPAAPAYVTRAQWGADEKLMTWPPKYAPTVRAVTIHHTAESNDYTPADSAAIVRGIYAYHSKGQHWGDIGYNALVDKFGTVFEGRAGGLDRASVAAHAGGFNEGTFGIAMMGDHSRVPPTAKELAGVTALAAWKLGGLYRDPDEQVRLTSKGGGTSRFPKGDVATVPALFAHRDVGNTACPGDAGYATMDALRASVRAIIAAAGNDVRDARAAHPDLGEPVRVERATADGRGRATDFEHGSVYWSARTGAWPVTGAIGERWRTAGAEASRWGYPTGVEHDVPGGRRQDFEHGSLGWTAAGGTVAPVD